jgi:hypothetical protein
MGFGEAICSKTKGAGDFHLKEEALDRIKWRNRFGRGCGPVV